VPEESIFDWSSLCPLLRKVKAVPVQGLKLFLRALAGVPVRVFVAFVLPDGEFLKVFPVFV